jgi:hypothetical protein
MADTFVIRPLRPGRLSDFLDHLHSVHQNNQVTMKMATFPSFIGDLTALWTIRYTVNLPILTFTSILILITTTRSWDSIVSTVTGLKLDNQGAGVQLPVE